MSSPNMNNLIIVGCLMGYISIVLLGLDGKLSNPSAHGIMCSVSLTAATLTLISVWILKHGCPVEITVISLRVHVTCLN